MPKRASIEFVPASQTKSLTLQFGGEPFGLPKSLWPISAATKQPMQFICQIPIDPDLFVGVTDSVAYLFMTSDCDGEETWVPDGGENALIIVPRDKLTSSITIGDAPRLYKMVKKWWNKKLVPQTCIFSVKLTRSEDPDFIPMSDDRPDGYGRSLEGNKLGGSPGFLQADEIPFSQPWHLLLQLDSTQVPFWINFGDAGIGYAFIDGAGTKGNFLWQCC